MMFYAGIGSRAITNHGFDRCIRFATIARARVADAATEAAQPVPPEQGSLF
jgi:hypothetical protein